MNDEKQGQGARPSPEPLSDERLAEIHESVANTAGTFRPPYYFAVVDLLGEVERLRARASDFVSTEQEKLAAALGWFERNVRSGDCSASCPMATTALSGSPLDRPATAPAFYCNCGDGFTADSVCVNCLTCCESDARDEGRREANERRKEQEGPALSPEREALDALAGVMGPTPGCLLSSHHPGDCPFCRARIVLRKAAGQEGQRDSGDGFTVSPQADTGPAAGKVGACEFCLSNNCGCCVRQEGERCGCRYLFHDPPARASPTGPESQLTPEMEALFRDPLWRDVEHGPQIAVLLSEIDALREKLAAEHAKRGEAEVARDLWAHQFHMASEHQADTANDAALSRAEASAEREEALTMARGCHDYNGGYGGAEREAYHHGIETVINVLTLWMKHRAEGTPLDSQRAAVRHFGAATTLAGPSVPSTQPIPGGRDAE